MSATISGVQSDAEVAMNGIKVTALTIYEFSQSMVQKRRPRFNTMCHFRPIAQTRKKIISQVPFRPYILSRMQRMPRLFNQRFNSDVDIVRHSIFRVQFGIEIMDPRLVDP